MADSSTTPFWKQLELMKLAKLEIDPFEFEESNDDLAMKALDNPHKIDDILLPILHDPDLVGRLHRFVRDFVLAGTPEVNNPWRDPGRPSNYYRSAVVSGTLLGRAFSLLIGSEHVISNHGAFDETKFWTSIDALPTELRDQIAEEYTRDMLQAARVSRIIYNSFGQGLLSGTSAECGNQLVCGALFLTCGASLERMPHLQGEGEDWDPFCSRFRASEPYSYARLKEYLPISKVFNLRGNTDPIKGLIRNPYDELDVDCNFVPQEVLDMYDAALEHIQGNKPDLTSREMMDRFLGNYNRDENVSMGWPRGQHTQEDCRHETVYRDAEFSLCACQTRGLFDE